MKIDRRITLCSLVIAVLISIPAISWCREAKVISSTAWIDPFSWDASENNYRVHIKATVVGHDSNDWAGCTVGNEDLPAKSIGTSRETVEWETRGNTGDDYTIALWDKKYGYGEGPDPDNSWGRKNGYYMYEELDRVEGKVGALPGK